METKVPEEIKVLDKGFVKLYQHIGGDKSVVDAARISHGESSKGAEADKKLIQYMLTHHHGTPFEHNIFTFIVKLPIFCARQWIRTRIGVSFNEISARYTEMKDDFYIPDRWRSQEKGVHANKQGSVLDGNISISDKLLNERVLSDCKAQMRTYNEFLDAGVAKEMARMVLPVNLYTEWYFTCNARSLMAFITLRSEDHAQWEMRKYSDALALYLRELMPWTYSSFYATLDHTKYTSLPTP